MKALFQGGFGPLLGLGLLTLSAGLVCGVVAWLVVGVQGVLAALAATGVSLPVAVAVAAYFRRRGLTVEAIIGGTLMRMALTGLLAGLVMLAFATMRGPVFLLAVGVIYLANLSGETWFVYQQHQRAEAERSGSGSPAGGS